MVALALFVQIAVAMDLTCNEELCPLAWVGTMQRGDGSCDPTCNSVLCGFDSPPGRMDFDDSDCNISCLISIGCLFPESLRSYCWQRYSYFNFCSVEDKCGWSRGICGYCNFGCKGSPGFQSDLADGVCKEECATPECAFDGGDCVILKKGFCAPGCFESMLGDGTCQPDCLLESCENDRGDCDSSLCSSDCLPYMVDDGECQSACHVEECQWDGADCDCSPGCTESLLANAHCDALCNSEDCQFDRGQCVDQCSPGCEGPMLGDGECDAECFNLSCDRDNGDCECAPGCAYSDIGHCKPECQVPECNYDMPDSVLCSATEPFDCSSAQCVDDFGEEVANCDYTCVQCGGTIHYKLSCCAGCCSEGYLPHPIYPDVCVRNPDRTSQRNPRIIHVATQANFNTPDGSEDNPYQTLSAAFASIYEKYVEVRLLPGAHSLTQSKYFISLSPTIVNIGVQVAQVEGLRRMKITSLSCVESPEYCARASILVSYESYLKFAGTYYIEFNDVDFISTLELKFCENVMDITCSSHTPVLDLSGGLTARLANVTFSGLKHAFSAVISVSSSRLLLDNVHFIDILIKNFEFSQAVVKATEAEILYSEGAVSRVNNRRDYQTSVAASGFLAAVESAVTIAGVNFTYNFAGVRDEDTLSFRGSLLFLQDCWNVVVTDCEFAFNVGYKGAIISYYTFTWNLTSGNYATAKRILESKIEVANCLFRNNTGRVGSAIYVHYIGAQQNFAIANCTFLNELAEVNGVIITESQMSSFPKQPKRRPAETANRRVWTVEYPLPTFSLTNLRFVNCSGGLVLDKTWVVTVQGVSIESGQLPAPDVATNSLQVLSTVPHAHTPLFVPYYPPQPCQSLLSITSVIYLSVESLSLQETVCNAGILISGSNITIVTSYFGYNSGLRLSGSTLHIRAGNVSFHSLIFEHNANGNSVGRGSVYLEAASVSIANCTFKNNSASMGGALYVNSTSTLVISDSEFEGNSADGGGALATEGVGSAAVSSTRFIGNYAENYAGAVCFLTTLESFHVKAEFADTVLAGSIAAKGSVLFVSQGVVLSTLFRRCQITDNVARQLGVCLFERGEVRFADTDFLRNSGTAVLRASLAPNRLELSNCLFEANNITAVITVLNSSPRSELLCTALVCQSNSGSCLDLERSVFTCTGCVFSRNYVQSGAGISARYSQVQCEDCTFDTNVAEYAGGAVLARSESQFACRRCKFLSNYSRWQGGALFFEENSTLSLDVSAFANNTALSGGFAVFLFKCNLASEIRNSVFIGNTGSNFGSINAASSHLALTGCNITENRSSNLMGGVMLSQSVASVESCRFFRQDGLSGTLFYAFGSNVTIANSVFRDSVAINTGAGMTLISSSVTIVNTSLCSLTSGLGGAISAQSGSVLLIDGCSFANITSGATNSGAVVATESLLTVLRSVFADYTEGGVAGASANLTVASSSFQSGRGTFGGGVFCSSCVAVNISGSRFDSLRADQGAAVYFEQGKGSITGCTFRHSQGTSSGAVHLEGWSGQLTNSSFLSNLATAGRGGAVHISFSAGNVTITFSHFLSNSAKEGGAVSWSGSQPSMSSNTFANNSALYGPDVASYGVKLALLGTANDYSNLTSGEVSEKPIVLVILDTRGQVIANDNKSYAKVETTDNKTLFSGVSRVQAQGGVFNFSELRVIGQPGTNTSLTISTPSLPGVNHVVVNVSLRMCRVGEALVSSQCVACAPGTYNLNAGGDCKDCPAGAFCLGSSTMTPKAGYWRSGLDLFHQCLNPEACVGTQCAAGYEGVMCQACAEGFYQWGKIYCAKCPGTVTSIASEVFVSVLVISSSAVFIVFVLRSQQRYYYACSVYIKIFVDYVQTVMLFPSFNLSWPQEVLQLFNAYEVFGAFPEYLVSANCLVSINHKILILALVQPGLVLLALAVWSLLALIRKSTQYLQSHFICSAIVLFLLAYPSVMRGVLSAFDCVQVGPGEFWLLQYNQQCWTTRYKRSFLAVAVPSAFCWGVAVPGLLLLALMRYNRLRLTYLTLGYADKRAYWEYAIIYRKVFLIICFVFMSHISTTSPATTALGGLLVSFVVHWKQPPYAYSEHSSMERRSLCVCAGTLYCGLVASTKEMKQSYAFFTAILLLNAYFVGLFAWKMCRTLRGATRVL